MPHKTKEERKSWYWRNREERLKKMKEYRDSKLGQYYIYYLPEEHYVGMTNEIARRISHHKRDGKIVDGHEVLGTCLLYTSDAADE